ncbi:MAG TPA: glutathione S-transferase family protein [Thermoleophilaceae bacterium]
MLKLYRAPFSTNVERVALALAYKGLAAESVWIEYAERSPVEQVSGQPLVPVLVDGDEVVVDSMRIVRFLEDKQPEPALYPAERARREELLVFIDWFNSVWKVWPNAIEAGRDIEANAAAMRGSLDRFEALLDGREHLMGDDFSAADIAAFPFLKFALFREPEDDEPFHLILEEHLPLAAHPRLADWARRVNERPRA